MIKEKFMQTLKNHPFTPKLFLWFSYLCLTAAFCLTLNFTAHAEVKIEKPKQTVYLRSADAGIDDPLPEILFYVELTCGDSIDESSVFSDNELVSGSINCYKPENVDSLYFGICPKNPGTANLSFEDQSDRTYTVTAEVLPYENPIKSFTITNVTNGADLAGKTDKSRGYRDKTFTFSKKTAAPKLKVVSQKDWQIISISVYTKLASGKAGDLQEIGAVNARSKTVQLQKAAKGDKIQVDIYLKNKKNGAYQCISFGKDLWRKGQ